MVPIEFLRPTPGQSNDIRILEALDLGGDEAKDFLERMAEEHAELRTLMDSFKITESGVSSD